MPEEQEQWEDIYPSMMSDEETIDAHTLKCRRPDWRGSTFNKIMDELDRRSYEISKHPRKVRILGTPMKCPVPPNVKDWMTADSDTD